MFSFEQYIGHAAAYFVKIGAFDSVYDAIDALEFIMQEAYAHKMEQLEPRYNKEVDLISHALCRFFNDWYGQDTYMHLNKVDEQSYTFREFEKLAEAQAVSDQPSFSALLDNK